MLTKQRTVQAMAALLSVALLLWVLSEEETETEASTPSKLLLSVTTIDLIPKTFRVTESLVGTTQPRWPLEVISAVEGRVVQINPGTEPGDRVSTEVMLMSVDDTRYQADVAASAVQIQQAELELAKFQHERTVVEQVSKAKALSAFGRFEPHINTAKANLLAAKKANTQAIRRLQETQFYPPFAAVVQERWVVPGQWVNVGDKLFTLMASDSIDVRAELSPQQMARLGNIADSAAITVTDPNGGAWQAKLRHQVPAQSSQTRQSQLVFYVENPFVSHHPLLPNSMVTVSISGPEVAHIVSAPSSVLTSDGFVWTVENAQLVKTAITPYETIDDRVWFKFKQQPGKAREVVLFPLSTMLQGQPITPKAPVMEVPAP